MDKCRSSEPTHTGHRACLGRASRSQPRARSGPVNPTTHHILSIRKDVASVVSVKNPLEPFAGGCGPATGSKVLLTHLEKLVVLFRRHSVE